MSTPPSAGPAGSSSSPALVHLLAQLERTDGVLAWDADWRCVHLNARGADLLGERAQLGARLEDVLPDPAAPLRQVIERAARQGNLAEGESYSPAQGCWVLARAFPHDHGVATVLQNLSGARYEPRILRWFVDVLELIAAGASLASALEVVVLLVEDLAPGTLGSVLLLDDDGRTIRHGAAPHLPPEYSRAIDGAPIGPRVGSCGTAAYTGRPVLVSDLATDPLWEDYRDLALPHGLRACWSYPILDGEGAVLGTFALYRREPGLPGKDIPGLVQKATHAARIAIEHTRQRDLNDERGRLLRQMSRLAKVGAWSFDADTGRGTWTEETARIHDLPPDSLPSVESGLDCFRGAHREAIEAAVQGAIERAEPYDLELQLVTALGNTKWVRTIGRPVLEDGRVVSVSGVMQDITARREAQDSAREQTQRLEQTRLLLQEVFDTTFDEVFVVDRVGPRWCYALLNARAEATLGTTTAEVRGKTPLEVFGPELGPRLLKNLDTCWEAQGPLHLVELIDVGARPRWFETILSPSTGPDGRGRITGFLHDISERKRAEEALKETLVSLQQAVSAGQVGLWDWDLRSDGVRFSPEWKRQIGYEPHEISDSFDEWEQRLHPEDREGMLALLRDYLAGAEPDFECEFRFRHKDGSFRHILARGSEVRDERGQRVRVVGSHVDLSELVELKSQFLQAQKMEILGRLASGVAHDFNNLLTAIQGYSELTLHRLPPHDPVRGGVEQIHKAGQRAEALTRQLLAFTRRQTPRPRVLDLNELVRDMLKMLERVLGETVALAVDLDPGGVTIKADPGQIEQVVLNLCVNARDAMPDGGRLEVSTRLGEGEPAGQTAILTVRDEGCGIPAHALSHIFEAFYTTKPEGQGTGLGLSTVKRIVDEIGGHIRVDTELGRGTAFEISLPTVKEPSLAGPPPADEAPEQGSGTILLVDDDAGVRALCREVLESRGFAVLPAASAKAALQAFEGSSAAIDLLVTDVVMPGMNGSELARRLRARVPDLPVLFVSGYLGEDVGADPGGAGVLSKPFTPSALVARVLETLSAPATGPE